MGVGPGATPTAEPMETDKNASAPQATSQPSKKYYIDSTYLYTPRENVEMASPLKDGLGKVLFCGSHIVVSHTLCSE